MNQSSLFFSLLVTEIFLETRENARLDSLLENTQHHPSVLQSELQLHPARVRGHRGLSWF